MRICAIVGIALLLSALWVLGHGWMCYADYVWRDRAPHGGVQQTEVAVGLGDDRIYVMVDNDTIHLPERDIPFSTGLSCWMMRGRATPFDGDWRWRGWGFAYYRKSVESRRSGDERPTIAGTDTRLAIPLWCVTSVAMLPFLLLVRAHAREVRREGSARNRRCARCGYDCRASPTRCPECGHATGERKRGHSQ